MNASVQPLEATRRQWCAMLAVAVNPSFPAEASAALCAMLPLLRDLSDDLFTTESMKHVARAERRKSVPSFDEIEAALLDYRRIFLPNPMRRIPAPNASLPQGRPPPDADEITYVENLLRPWRHIEQPQAAAVVPEPPAAPLRNVALSGEALRRSREARGIKVVIP